MDLDDARTDGLTPARPSGARTPWQPPTLTVLPVEATAFEPTGGQDQEFQGSQPFDGT